MDKNEDCIHACLNCIQTTKRNVTGGGEQHQSYICPQIIFWYVSHRYAELLNQS